MTFIEIAGSKKWKRTHVRFLNKPDEMAGASICRRVIMDFAPGRREIRHGERPTCKICGEVFDWMRGCIRRWRSKSSRTRTEAD